MAGEAERLALLRERIRSGMARDVRLRHGLSFSEMGRSIGVTPSTILRWERGENVARGPNALTYGDLLDRLIGGGR